MNSQSPQNEANQTIALRKIERNCSVLSSAGHRTVWHGPMRLLHEQIDRVFPFGAQLFAAIVQVNSMTSQIFCWSVSCIRKFITVTALHYDAIGRMAEPNRKHAISYDIVSEMLRLRASQTSILISFVSFSCAHTNTVIA